MLPGLGWTEDVEKLLFNYQLEIVNLQTEVQTHLQNLLFYCSSICNRSAPHERKVSHEHFCCLCFTSSALSTYQNGLASLFIYHCPDM